jgi:hypothetical protein
MKKQGSSKHQPTEFRAKLDPKSKPGEWRGRFVPVTPKQKKAAAKLAKVNAPLNPADYF